MRSIQKVKNAAIKGVFKIQSNIYNWNFLWTKSSLPASFMNSFSY